MPDRPLVFIHIPKTAGQSLHRIIQRQLRGLAFFRMNGERDADGFSALPFAERASYDYISGHFIFRDFFPEGGICPRYMTMLRHPIPRILSLYRFIRRSPHHPLNQLVLEQNLSLDGMIDESMKPVDNVQVRVLAGRDCWRKPFGTIEKSDLERAVANIQEHTIVTGIQERFDDSVRLYSNAFGWNPDTIEIQTLNVAPSRDDEQICSDRTRDRLTELNRFDRALHAWATERFEVEIGSAQTRRPIETPSPDAAR